MVLCRGAARIGSSGSVQIRDVQCLAVFEEALLPPERLASVKVMGSMNVKQFCHHVFVAATPTRLGIRIRC